MRVALTARPRYEELLPYVLLALGLTGMLLAITAV
jgi:hypothetical protein